MWLFPSLLGGDSPVPRGAAAEDTNGGCWCFWQQKKGLQGACAALCCCSTWGKGKAAVGPARKWDKKRVETPEMLLRSAHLALFWGFILLIPTWLPSSTVHWGVPPWLWLWHRLWQLCGICTRPCSGCPASNHPIDYHFDSCCFIYSLSNNLLNKTLL